MVKTQRHAWRVERSLSLSGGGYGAGWLAMQNGTGIGAWFPTWREALDFAVSEADRLRPKLIIESTGIRPPSNVRRDEVQELLDLGLNRREAAEALGISQRHTYRLVPSSVRTAA